MIAGWQKELHSALQPSSPREFATSAVKLLRASDSLSDFSAHTGSHIARHLYREAYTGSYLNSFLSFIAAVQLGRYMQPIAQFHSLSQALWYAAREARPEPALTFPSPDTVVESDSAKSIESKFREYQENGQFDDFRGWVIGRMADPVLREELASWMLSTSMGDLANMGHRYLSAAKSIALMEEMRWSEPEHYLFPMLHYFFHAPENRWAEEAISQRLEYHRLELRECSYNRTGLSSDQTLQIRDAVLTDTQEGMIDTLLGALDYEVDPFDLAEAMMVTAAYMILSVPYDRWIFPIHGFNYAHTVFTTLEYLTPLDRQKAILVVGLHLKRLTESASPINLRGPYFTERPEPAKPGPNDLEEAIDLSIPQDAMAIVDWLYHHGQLNPRFFEQLALEAAKSDGDRHFGHDMMFSYAAIDAYHSSASPLRQYYLLALVKFLAESEKSREVDHALAQALRGR